MYANGDKDMKPLDLVVTSPLTRCLETAHHAFSMGCPLPPAPLQEDEYRSLMKQAKSEGKSRTSGPRAQCGAADCLLPCGGVRTLMRYCRNIAATLH